jgi:hypothetical protein
VNGKVEEEHYIVVPLEKKDLIPAEGKYLRNL